MYIVQDMLAIANRSGRIALVGENEALILLIGLFVGRALITTVSKHLNKYSVEIHAR
jgi:hypothetical protein